MPAMLNFRFSLVNKACVYDLIFLQASLCNIVFPCFQTLFWIQIACVLPYLANLSMYYIKENVEQMAH